MFNLTFEVALCDLCVGMDLHDKGPVGRQRRLIFIHSGSQPLSKAVLSDRKIQDSLRFKDRQTVQVIVQIFVQFVIDRGSCLSFSLSSAQSERTSEQKLNYISLAQNRCGAYKFSSQVLTSQGAATDHQNFSVNPTAALTVSRNSITASIPGGDLTVND
jgi:hypothetical protein